MSSPRTKPARQAPTLTFQPNGDLVPFIIEGSGRPPADALERLAAFRKKYPLRKLRKGQKSAVELIRELRDSGK